MTTAPVETIALDDPVRLQALYKTQLLDTPPEQAFDRLTELAQKLLRVPVSMVSLVDVDRQFIKSGKGLPEPVATQRETPLSHSFCKHVVASAQPLVVEDAREHPTVCDNLAIRDMGVVAYLGIPLFSHSGAQLGSLCAIDRVERNWTASDVQVLTELAALVMSELALREHLEERKRAEKALQALNDSLEERVHARTVELERLNEELQQFAYIASHDLQEPLRKISAFSTLFLEEYGAGLDEMGSHYLSRIEHSARRMAQLLRDLLQYSRIPTHKQDFVAVSLSEVVRQLVVEKAGVLEEIGDTIEVGDLPTIEGEPAQLRLLLAQLLNNALRFRRPGVPPAIRIDATCRMQHGASKDTARQVCDISVVDNGIGIETRFLDRIFKPFERLHGRSAYPGTGMGLAICQRIVERHQGTLTVESTPGKGSTFRVTLPVEQR